MCYWKGNFGKVIDNLARDSYVAAAAYTGFDEADTENYVFYAKKMGEKYLKRYKKYFRDPEIREFDMQHEQWLFGGEQYTAPVLQAIDEFMELAEK